MAATTKAASDVNPLIGSKSCVSADAPDFFRLHGVQVLDRTQGRTQRLNWWDQQVGGFGAGRAQGSVGVGARSKHERGAIRPSRPTRPRSSKARRSRSSGTCDSARARRRQGLSS